MALLGGAVSGTALLLGEEKAPEQTKSALPVEVLELDEVASFQQSRTFTGTISSRRTSELTFRRTGRLISVVADEGDRVEAGFVLAQLDLRPLEARRDELQAQRAEAQAVLDELVAGPRQEVIAAARAKVKDLDARTALADTQHRRNVELIRSNSLAEQELDTTKFTLDSTKAQLDFARHQLEELLNGTRKEQVAAAKAKVAGIDAMLESLRVDIEDSSLTAPFAGVVSERYIDEGPVVTPGQQILRLVEADHLEARIGVPSEYLSSVEVGSTSSLTVGSGRVSAVLRSILPELDASTRTRTLLFDIHDAHGQLAPGRIVRLDLERNRQTTGYWVPTSALTRGTRGLWTVYVAEPIADGHVVKPRDVEVLFTQGEQSLIRGTVSSGERAIVSGNHRVVPGQAVRPTP